MRYVLENNHAQDECDYPDQPTENLYQCDSNNTPLNERKNIIAHRIWQCFLLIEEHAILPQAN